jgi:hypothetical protein
LHGHGASAGRFDLMRDALGTRLIAGIGERHMGAGLAKGLGDSGADSLRRWSMVQLSC